jgi:hypothetical protein
VWTDEIVDEQLENMKTAENLAKRFNKDAAAMGFKLDDFNFDDASLMFYITQAIAAPQGSRAFDERCPTQ